MIKKLRVFFCLVLVVVLPLCFVACKSSKNPQSSGGEPGSGSEAGGEIVQPTTPENPSDGGDNSDVSYVIDDTELNRILKASYDVCEDFIVNLNNSNLLAENGYTDDEGGKTYPVFDYAFYPARFAIQYSTNFEQEKLYARQVSTTKKFFEVKVSETNDNIYVSMLIDEVSTDTVTAYFYEYGVTNGNINSLKISHIVTDLSYIQFSEALLDFKNSACEIALGTVNEFSSNRNFLEKNFTSEKFALIDKEKWGYSYYQKFDLKENDFVVNKNKMPLNENMIAYFDNFGFLNVFEKLDDYRVKENSELTNLNQDYFLYCSTNGMIFFDRDNSTFEFKTEEE